MEVALGDPNEQPAPQGAIGKIAQQPVGFLLLAIEYAPRLPASNRTTSASTSARRSRSRSSTST
ncbi:hypothetical protein AB0L13_33695 [Saccharopolyspora shandongensis]|uniref:hypothetical protein n=1 Tax=Saccharopolyspora shandongensis TaxID=418495 RepID=UPI0034186A65